MPENPPVLIRNARLIDPASGTDATRDVALAGGTVAEIGSGLSPAPAARVIEAEGRILAPGLIDPHVHLREPGQEHKETIQSGSRAAANGGFTAVCCMPNTSPAIDSPEIIHSIHDRAASADCRVFPIGAATVGRKGERLTETNLLARAGAVGFSDDGDVIASAGMMAAALTAIAPTGLAFMQHCQEPTMTVGSTMHAGEVSTRLGLKGWPRSAEEIIVARDIRIVQDSGCRYHAQHLSSAGSIDLIRRARSAGLPVTGEATPHHLLITHAECAAPSGRDYNTLAKVNPPIREQADVDALREAVAEGVITVLGTDHAPHSAEEKSLPFEEAPFGMIGLDFALPLYAEALVHSGAIDWPRLIALMTTEPAALCNLDRHGLGSLAQGGPADCVLIDPDLAWTITPDELAGMSINTPFLGRQVTGRAVLTIAAGRVTSDRL